MNGGSIKIYTESITPANIKLIEKKNKVILANLFLSDIPKAIATT